VLFFIFILGQLSTLTIITCQVLHQNTVFAHFVCTVIQIKTFTCTFIPVQHHLSNYTFFDTRPELELTGTASVRK